MNTRSQKSHFKTKTFTKYYLYNKKKYSLCDLQASVIPIAPFTFHQAIKVSESYKATTEEFQAL